MLHDPITNVGIIASQGIFSIAEVSATSRYFSELDSVLQSHYIVADPLLSAVNVRIKCNVSIIPTANMGMLGNTVNTANYMRISATSQIRVVSNSGASYSRETTVGDGKLHSLEFVGTTTTGELFIDGVSQGSSGGDFSVFNVDIIGDYLSSSNFRFFDGIISDFEFETQGVTVKFPLNLPYGDFEFSDSTTFGNEEITNNRFIDTTDWYSPRSSSSLSVVGTRLRATANSGATFGQSTTMTGLTIGKSYTVKGRATSNNPLATLRLRVSSTVGLTTGMVSEVNGTSDISIDDVFVATATTMYIGTIVTGHTGGDTVDIHEGISITEVIGKYVEYVNIPEANRDRFNLENDTTWLSENLIIDPKFLEGTTHWTEGANMSYSTPNVIGSNLNTPSNSELRQSDAFHIGYTYNVSYKGEADTGAYGMQNAAFSVLPSRQLTSVVDSVSFQWVADTANFSCKRASDVNNLTFHDPFIQRVLEIV